MTVDLPAPTAAPGRPTRLGERIARVALLVLTVGAVVLTVVGMVVSGHTSAVHWVGLGVAVVLAVAAGWIIVRPGRSTRIVCLSFLGVLLAGAPFLAGHETAVIRLYGFVLINLALLWVVMPGLGTVLRRHLRWIMLGIGLYLIALSFALVARDEWRRYHVGTGVGHSAP